jgi:hypothetical protein
MYYFMLYKILYIIYYNIHALYDILLCYTVWYVDLHIITHNVYNQDVNLHYIRIFVPYTVLYDTYTMIQYTTLHCTLV